MHDFLVCRHLSSLLPSVFLIVIFIRYTDSHVYVLPYETYGVHLRVYNNNLHLFIATSSSPTSLPLISIPITFITAARSKFKGTESVDNNVSKLEGELLYVRTAKTVRNNG